MFEFRMRMFRTLAVLALSLFMGCGPNGALRSLFEDDDPGGGGPNLQFQAPSDGDVVDEPTTISVNGDGVLRAVFSVDGNSVYEDLNAPFEWTLDPANHVLGSYQIAIFAEATGGSDSYSAEITLERELSAEQIRGEIAALATGHWYEVPNTRLRRVAYSNPDDYRGQVADIMEAASGAAYDTNRDRLVVFGGGDNYSGNELYVFDIATMEWSRIVDPSAFPEEDPNNSSLSVIHPDGSPVSRHTYDAVEYVPPPVDRLIVGGGHALYPGAVRDTTTFIFDFDTLTWTIGPESCPSIDYGSVCAVAPNGTIWQHGGGNDKMLASWDPQSQQWAEHAEYSGFYGYGTTGEIDPVVNTFVAVGGGATYVWDLDNPNQATQTLLTTGATEIESSANPGLAYDPESEVLVAWAGGRDVFALDVSAGTWTRVPGPGGVSPGSQTPRGTFGRWRYVHTLGVFLTVSSVDNNVFVYRPTLID